MTCSINSYQLIFECHIIQAVHKHKKHDPINACSTLNIHEKLSFKVIKTISTWTKYSKSG